MFGAVRRVNGGVHQFHQPTGRARIRITADAGRGHRQLAHDRLSVFVRTRLFRRLLQSDSGLGADLKLRRQQLGRALLRLLAGVSHRWRDRENDSPGITRRDSRAKGGQGEGGVNAAY